MSNDSGQALVCEGGFIRSHLVKRLELEAFCVRSVDVKLTEFAGSAADEFVQADLRDPDFCDAMTDVSNFYQWPPMWAGRDSCFGDHDVSRRTTTF
jgi:hypothetical protein